MKPLTEELFKVLRNVYGFETDSYVIDASDNWEVVCGKPGAKFARFRARFRSFEEPGTLLVCYYL